MGEPRIHNGIGLWPVFAESRPEPAYIMLAEALSLDGFMITEISEGGTVPNLRVINETAHTSCSSTVRSSREVSRTASSTPRS